MKKYVLVACTSIGVLLLTFNVFAQTAADQPAGQGRGAGGRAGGQNMGGRGMMPATVQRPNRAGRLAALEELQKQIAILRESIKKSPATDPDISSLQSDEQTTFMTQYNEENEAINQIVTTLNNIRPVSGGRGGFGGRGGGGLTTEVIEELTKLAQDEKATKLLARLEALATEVQAAAARGGRGMGGGRGGGGPVPETGFVQIFDGKTLSGWEGDSRWRVENGTIVAETTADNPLRQNTFLIWRGGAPADFELKLEYRLTGGNSGIQYRSRELEGGSFAMGGYQSDIDANLQYAGMIYDERGPGGFLAPRGQFNYRGPSMSGTIATLGAAEDLRSVINADDWNSVHIIARGNTLIQIYNDRVMSMLIDDDTENRSMKGLIGLQLHTGQPMKIEFRNIRLKEF